MASFISVAALALHAAFFFQAGPLWRDEICGLNLAMSAPEAMWSDLQFDAFPIGWFAILRAWAGIVPEGDQWLRLLGVLVGTSLIAALWRAGASMTGRAPILSMALLLVDAGTVRFGDSLRGYGIGLLFGASVYWSFWQLGERRDRRSFWIAAVAAVAAVQIHYYNAIVVLASAAGASARGSVSGARGDALRPLAAGAIAAVTLLPYGFTLADMRGWNSVVKYDIGLSWLHWMWQTSHAGSGPLAIVTWDVAIVLGVALSIAVLLRRRGAPEAARHHACAFLIATAAYLAFLLAVSYHMAPWYYLTLSLVAAITLDALAAASGSARLRVAVALFALVYVSATLGPAFRFVSERLTNADVVAADVAVSTKTGDLVVVAPWAGMISWQRYYTGPARSLALPLLHSYDVHRFDQYLAAITDPAALATLLSEIDATIARGGRVIVVRNVGGSTRIPRNPPKPTMRDLPDYWAEFEAQLAARTLEMVELPPPPKGSEYESFASFELRAPSGDER